MPYGADSRMSDCYRSYNGDNEIFCCSFYFKNLSFVHKSIFNNEQLKQLESIQADILKKQGLDFNFSHSVGRKNKLSKIEIDSILNSDKSYRQLANDFNCSVGLIAKVKKGGV